MPESHEPLKAEALPPQPTDQLQPQYTPEDDTYCWICGGPVTKRHCKIICPVCGFVRDCSDP